MKRGLSWPPNPLSQADAACTRLPPSTGSVYIAFVHTRAAARVKRHLVLPLCPLAMRMLAVLICAFAFGCASRPQVDLSSDVVAEENASDFLIQITRVSDLGTAGVTLGGRATDAERGIAIAGLNVVVADGPQRGVSTGPGGWFTLDSLRMSQTLRFQFVGYRTLRASVGDLVERRRVGPSQER